jgi:two-component system LytT family sensor kinase
LLVVEPLVEAVRTSTQNPTAGAWIVATVLWCALLLVFPGLERAVNRAADRWLFQRPDYRRLTQAFSWEIEPLETEEEVFTLAEERIHTALGVAAVQVMTSDHLTANAAPTEEVGAVIPIQVNAVGTHAVVIASGEQSRKLLSDELAFLQAMAERIGRKIESLQFQRERRERELREARLQHSLTEAELKALRAQVNPHFLFNTLNTIADLISSEPEKAEAMTERLAEVFRYVLARTERSVIPISEEFEFLRTYLEIEQARFGDRLRVELTAEPSVLSVPIPSLLLQPLVENAVKHGLAPKLGGGTLRVSAVDEGEFVRFVVEDDGVGWAENKKTVAVAEAGDSSRQEGGSARQFVARLRDETLNNVAGPGGVGLRNVAERLRTLYGERAELTVRSSTGQGTSVSILVPKYA